MPDKISSILNDRESGSVALLNRLIDALKEELQGRETSPEAFSKQLSTLREKLSHFAAIENFLASLITQTGQKQNFPGEALRFIADYSSYWQDHAGKLTENFLLKCEPEGRTILTHSHSETVFSLLDQLHSRQIPFRVLQTLSSPGEEGRKSFKRMRQRKLRAELIDDQNIADALSYTDLILVGCDALLPAAFLNKTGTRSILQQAKRLHIRTFLVTESRKEITRTEWKRELTEQALFEWVPLNLIDQLVTERQI